MSIFDGVTAPLLRVEYDAALPLGPKNDDEADWTEIPLEQVRAISIRRGKTQENQLVQPGELTITFDNRSGDFDPMNESSPYWITTLLGGYSYFSTNLGVRVVSTWNEVDYTLYVGYLEQLSMDYGLNPTATVTFVDSLAWIAKQQMTALETPEGNGDEVWYRIAAALTTIGFPSNIRDIDPTVTNTLYGTTYGADALSLMQTWADCGPARLFVDREGYITLLPWDGGLDSGLTLSDDPSDTEAVGYDLIEVDPGSKYLLNYVTVNKINGLGVTTGTVVAVDVDSEGRFGPVGATYDLPTNTAEPVATFLANQYSEPFDRVRRITFSNVNLGENFTKTMFADIPDFVTINRTTYDGRALSFTCQIEGIEHDITPDSWRMGYICSSNQVVTSLGWATSLSPVAPNRMGVSSAGASYVAGIDQSDIYSGSKFIIAKQSSDGSLAWAKQFSYSYIDFTQQRIAVASDGFSLVTARMEPAGGGDETALIARLGDNGTLASRTEGPAGFLVKDCAYDSVNFIIGGNNGSNGFFGLILSSNGDLYYQKEIVGTSATVATSVAGTYEEAWIAGYSTGDFYFLLKANNDTGALIWDQEFAVSTTYPPMVAVDGSGNSYLLYRNSTGLVLTKLDIDGVVVWQKLLTHASGLTMSYVAGLSVDDAGNVLVSANVSGSPYAAIVMLFDPAGDVTWQRQLTEDGAYRRFYGGRTAAFGAYFYWTVNQYVINPGVDPGVETSVTLKLPLSGAGPTDFTLGSVTYTYAASAVTVADTTETPSTGDISVTTASVTLTDSSLVTTSALLSDSHVEF